MTDQAALIQAGGVVCTATTMRGEQTSTTAGNQSYGLHGK